MIVDGCLGQTTINYQLTTNLMVGVLQRVECGMMKISNRKILALLMVMLMSGSGSVYAATSTANRPVVRVRRTNTTQNVRISRPVQVGNTSARNARVSSTTSHISSTGLRGDINGDGQVNSNDLALLKQYLNNSSVTINKADADMNNDGVINIADYNYLVQFLNPPQPILKGDVNGDGKVNEADYNLLNQFISGQKVSNFHHYNTDMNNDKKFTTTDLSQLRSKVQVTPADTYTVFTIPNGWYEIAPLADGNMRLDVDDGREGNGVTIKLFTRNGHAAQRFLVNNVGNGYFTMRTGCNGYVDLEYGRTANGSRICQYEKEADNGKCQKFRAIRRNNEAAVYLEPILQPGLAITCANHSTAAETKVVIWSRENSNYQKWQFIKTNGVLLPVSVKEGLYSLQPMCAPNTELTVSGASKNLSAPVVISNQGSANQTTKSHQKWLVTSVGNGYYKITAENSGLALNNHNGANVNGNPISIYTYSGYCQEFRFYDAGNGYYIIQPKNVSGVLDVAGGGNANNTRVQLYQYNGSAAQKWKLVSRQRGVDPDPYKQWDAYPKRTCNVYTNSALTKRTPGINEYVDTSDPVTVLGESGNAYYIRYKAKSGYKDRWVTKDIFKEDDLQSKFRNLQGRYPSGTKYTKTVCSDGWRAIECHGYALQLRIYLTGKNPMRTCRKIKDKNAIDNLQSGDLIRYRNDGHTILVTAVNGEDVTYTDCNWYHDKVIRWNVHITKQELKKNFHVYSGSNDYVMKYNG